MDGQEKYFCSLFTIHLAVLNIKLKRNKSLCMEKSKVSGEEIFIYAFTKIKWLHTDVRTIQ